MLINLTLEKLSELCNMGAFHKPVTILKLRYDIVGLRVMLPLLSP